MRRGRGRRRRGERGLHGQGFGDGTEVTRVLLDRFLG
jgi:hypothetical protein